MNNKVKSQRATPTGARRKFQFDAERKPVPAFKRDTLKLVTARAEKAQNALDRWTRRLVIAQRRVTKLSKQVRYYNVKLSEPRRATE